MTNPHGMKLKPVTNPLFDIQRNKDALWLDRFLTPIEVAIYLGISKRHVYELMARREIETQSIGRLKRIRLSTLEKWLNLQNGGFHVTK